MYQTFQDAFQQLLGYEADPLQWYHLLIRAVLVYGIGLGLTRLGKRRFMGTYSAVDMILGVTIGALLSASASDSASFSNALWLVLLLGGLHWLFAFASYHSPRIERVLKGSTYPVINDGELDQDNLRSAFLTHDDMAQALRSAGVHSAEDVQKATFERSGQISICPRARSEAQVVTVDVADGVQRVVIEVRGGA